MNECAMKLKVHKGASKQWGQMKGERSNELKNGRKRLEVERKRGQRGRTTSGLFTEDVYGPVTRKVSGKRGN